MKSVTEWLDITAERMPKRLALADETTTVTYAEYRRKALSIARHIISQNIMQKPVVVFLEKSTKIPQAFLGIAYSGCFYTPIDPNTPSLRIEKMIANLQPSLVITDRHHVESFAHSGYLGPYLYYEDCIPACGDAEAVKSVVHSPENLLYVLYTSGSTGTPKGVCIKNISVLNYIDWVCRTFSITEEDSFGNQAPFYFDNSILDIYTALKTGASVYIIPKILFSQPALLLNYLKEHAITTIFWVPSALIIVAKLHGFKNIILEGSLKRVLFCGEVMPNRHLNYWRRALPTSLFANLYGPTEITDVCTWYLIEREFDDEEPLPIGKPIDNVEILLINGDNQGAEGEICVKGISLSPGYYRDPKRTLEVFVPDPRDPSETIYRTGDLGRYNKYGELMYLGRKDFQIKFHGHRVELGEIETIANSIEGVTSCCLYDEKEDKIVLFLEKGAIESSVSNKIKQYLPKYMMPSRILIIEEMPINTNGKIDRLKLKEML